MGDDDTGDLLAATAQAGAAALDLAAVDASGSVPMKLYTLYAPPNHRDGVVHHSRAEAEADNEHFDGNNDGIISQLNAGVVVCTEEGEYIHVRTPL